jgi:putative membrane protein
MPSQPSSPFDAQTELAKERNRIAADRTLLAWIRSGITLISFGAGLDQILRALYSNPARADLGQLTKAVNLGLIGLGTLILLLAISDYQGELQRFDQPTYRYTPRLTIGMVVTPVLIYLAMGAFAVIWARTTA